MSNNLMNRRLFLLRAGLIGCSAAASPLLTPMTFAAAPWDNRLVVIVLRGAMDGLDVVQPYGDPSYGALRNRASMPGMDAEGGPNDLDGFYALHPALAGLMPMWQAGQLAFTHAVSTPYRDKRSHFDGQDLLEAGTSPDTALSRDGWLNRMMQTVPGIEAETAYAIGRDDMLLTSGAAPVANWSPEATLSISPQAQRLFEMVMHGDPAMRDAMAEAVTLAALEGDAGMSDQTGGMMGGEMADSDPDPMRAMVNAMLQARKQGGHVKVAEFAAQKLRHDTRIAAFSINGWDTHAAQDTALPKALVQLGDTLLTLQAELGPVWAKTTVIAMTEFGRTARINGTRGTDHGTAGAMLLAGGAVRGGQVVADWPGLGEADLYNGRDLMPVRDVRDHAAWVMRGLFGLSQSALERDVFPGLSMAADPRLIL